MRYDSSVTTAARNVPYGSQAALYTVPFATAYVCTDAGCTIPAPIFVDSGMTSQIANSIVEADVFGKYGFWIAAGTYYQRLVDSFGDVLGIFPFTVGGSGGSSGVTSLEAAGASPLTGALTIAAGTGITVTQSGSTITIGLTAAVTRSYGGVGAAGATSTITASGTTATLSTGDVLATIDTAASNVGTTYGPFSPSGQSVYLLLFGGSHTFQDTGTGFSFAMNAGIATTVNGLAMYLYQSTNALYGTFNIKVVS